LTITNVPGLDIAGTMSAPAAGTPAYNVFNGYIDWTTSNPGIHIYPTNTVGYLFSGLDPAKQYKFIGTAIRGGTAQTTGNEYSNRWTRAQLFGALSWTPAHSAHVVTTSQFPADLTGNQAAWNAGVNHTAGSGDIIEWDNIVPVANGTFTIVCTKYNGAIPAAARPMVRIPIRSLH